MNLDAEWLEPDGRGGFASGTVGGARSRRYHAFLLPATRPPVARLVLVNGLEIWLETSVGRFPLSTQRYTGSNPSDPPSGILAPRGQDFLTDFHPDPWPRWTFRFPDGTDIEQELFVHQASGATCLHWRLLNPSDANAAARLELRPLFSGRDYHSLHHENPAFAFAPCWQDHDYPGNALWQPYVGVPGIRVWVSGTYRHDPAWYRHFLYLGERARGLDDTEDLAVPGVFTCELGRDTTAAMLLAAEPVPGVPSTVSPLPPDARAAELLPGLLADEQRRRDALSDPLRRAGDAYLVRGLRGPTIIAGYPWFTDWGRDTFISLRGLCLAAGRFDEAREILLQWAGAVSQGMLPNRFPDGGEPPEYNTVDAALWFIAAVFDYLALLPPPADADGQKRAARDEATLRQTGEAILAGYAAGTRYGIRLDPEDGLLFAGAPGFALTWMDARIDNGQPVTPRMGKPVEIQALWLNALHLLGVNSSYWQLLYERARASFERKFWNDARGCLFDVVDTDFQPGKNDDRLRPNQIFAVGGLPLALLSDAHARAVVDTVERELLTPTGLRTLAPGEPGYCAYYNGDSRQRDSAYHQGTAWPWLLGPFVEAWVRVRGDNPATRADARARFLDPILSTMPQSTGINHLPEITDAESPFAPKGCPFQAWSVGEITRLALGMLK